MQRVLVFSAVAGRSNNFALNQTGLVAILREAKLQRSGRSPRGQAFNLRSLFSGIDAASNRRCLKAWPHASHFVAALRSTWHCARI